jgi:PAS domain-containing protein
LQVHQVEVDLQAEELRASREELEAALHRQMQLYDSAPVGFLTVDVGGALHELNLTGATLLGSERQALLGQPLYGFLVPDSARALQAMLKSVGEGRPGQVSTLHLLPRAGESQAVYAIVNADPAGRRFLVAFIDAGANHGPAK